MKQGGPRRLKDNGGLKVSEEAGQGQELEKSQARADLGAGKRKQEQREQVLSNQVLSNQAVLRKTLEQRLSQLISLLAAAARERAGGRCYQLKWGDPVPWGLGSVHPKDVTEGS